MPSEAECHVFAPQKERKGIAALVALRPVCCLHDFRKICQSYHKSGGAIELNVTL